jgi:hypothetical protein
MLDERAKVITEEAKVLDKRTKVARDHNLHWHALRWPLQYSLQAFLPSKLAAVKRSLAGHETARETARMITRVEARMERIMLDPLAGRGLCLCAAIWKAMTKMTYPSLARRPRSRGREKRFICLDLALIHGAVCTKLRQLANVPQLLQASRPHDGPHDKTSLQFLAPPSATLAHYKQAGFTASQITHQMLQTKGEMEQKLEKGKRKEKAKD